MAFNGKYLISCSSALIILHKVVLSLMSADEKAQCIMVLQMKATEQYFHVVLFIMLYRMVLTCKSVDETPVCDHSNESY